MKKILIGLSFGVMVSIGSISAMEDRPTSQGKYKIDPKGQAVRYLEKIEKEHQALGYISFATLARGARIKQSLDPNDFLVTSINNMENALIHNNGNLIQRNQQRPGVQRRLTFD